MSTHQFTEISELEAAEVVRLARQADVRLVRFLYCDNAGLIRGKASHVDALAGRLRSGLGLPMSMQATNMLDQIAPDALLGVAGEVRLVPDRSTFTVLPYAPHSAAMVADLSDLSGSAWALCTRSFLKRELEAALRQGLQLQAAFEPEWVIGVRQGDDYVPFDESPALSGVGMATAGTIIDEIIAALESQGLHVEQYHPEAGHAQQEITLQRTHGLAAADQHLLYRETIRSVVYRHGFFASFTPKPWPNQPGNGCHIHVSLWDPTGEHNLFYDESGGGELSAFGKHFLAGMLDHLPALLALTCPSFNSYLRLQPSARAAAFVSYGRDNREAAVRVVSPFRGQERATTNLELRAADSSCNPYLALGGLLAAGLDGVRRELRPPAGLLVSGDPAGLSESERAARGIRALPCSLAEAITALETDDLLLSALGEPLARAFLAVRRSEWQAFAKESTYAQHRLHFWKY